MVVVVNVLAMALGTLATADVARSMGMSPWWGIDNCIEHRALQRDDDRWRRHRRYGCGDEWGDFCPPGPSQAGRDVFRSRRFGERSKC
jgi:hypothetical protein